MGNKHGSQSGGGKSDQLTGRSAASRAKNVGASVASKFASSDHISASTLNTHLERASKTGILQLKHSGLKLIPPTVFQTVGANLRNLDLSSNKLSAIPAEIGQLCQLKQLRLASNRLESLPDELGQLKKLEILDVSQNQLVTLPETLVALLGLKNVNVSENNLTDFPHCLCDCPNLEMVDASKNRIDSLSPSRIGNFKGAELNLNQNRLGSLPLEISLCQNLKILRLEENCLPLETFTEELLTQSKVSLLALEGNLFQEKDFHHVPGYDAYMERYTATKKKIY